ncbi:MAG: hypothetical protein RIB71_16265 [Imperialibacter sp.]
MNTCVDQYYNQGTGPKGKAQPGSQPVVMAQSNGKVPHEQESE